MKTTELFGVLIHTDGEGNVTLEAKGRRLSLTCEWGLHGAAAVSDAAYRLALVLDFNGWCWYYGHQSQDGDHVIAKLFAIDAVRYAKLCRFGSVFKYDVIRYICKEATE